MNIEIGKKIRLLRLGRGLTQEQLAEKLCVTAQSVSKWENDVTAPDIGLLPQISAELGVTIDELFSMTDEVRLSRIENLLSNSSKNTVIPQCDFESYRTLLIEHKDVPKLRGRVLTALAWLYDQQATAYHMSAAKYAKEAIEFQPEEKSNHSVLCMAMNGADRDWYTSNNHELIDYYMDFVEKYPDNVPALQLLLDNLIADNRADEAEFILAKLKRCDDTCRVLWYKAQICHIRGDKASAQAELHRMTEQFSEDWLAWAYKGDFYARLAEYDKASECWLRSHELQPSPKMTDNLLCLAEVCVIRKQYDKAALYYRDTVELLKTDYNTTEGDMIDHFKARAEMYEKM